MKQTYRAQKIVDRLLEVKSKALLFFKNKNYVESLKLLEEAIKISPSDLELLFYETLCLYHLGNIDRASLIIEQLYEMDTDHMLPSLPKVCSVILLKNGKFKKARAVIDTHLKHNPEDIQWLNMLGYAYEKNGQISDAEQIYLKILTKNATNANACNALAYLYLSNCDKHDKANQLIEKALQQDPKNFAYLDTLGMLKIAAGEFELGLKTLKEALSYSPGNQEILAHINETVQC